MDKLLFDDITHSAIDVLDATEAHSVPPFGRKRDEPLPAYSVSSLLDGRTAYEAVYDSVRPKSAGRP